RVDRDAFEAAKVIGHAWTLDAGILARYFEDARVQLPHYAHQFANLIPACKTAGHWLPIGRLMVAGARSGEADCASGDGIANLALHCLQLIFISFVRKSALAHHIGAQS